MNSESSTALTGAESGPLAQRAETRWMMAYSAALGATSADFLDNSRMSGVVAHALFPVCYEWPLWRALHGRLLPPELLERGVHATHELTMHRPLVAGEMLHTRAVVERVEDHRAGMLVVTRFDTWGDGGDAISTSRAGSIYRNAQAADPPQESHREAQADAGHRDATTTTATHAIRIERGLAHIYSECSKIWNPIHTDVAVAHRAGLPDIVLHGTATLGLTVGTLLEAHGRLGCTRVACRFRAPVWLPSTLVVEERWDDSSGRNIEFRVHDGNDRVLIDRGKLELA